jgi:hypothetical protein
VQKLNLGGNNLSRRKRLDDNTREQCAARLAIAPGDREFRIARQAT